MEFIKLKPEEKSNHEDLIYFYNLKPNKNFETRPQSFFIFFIFVKNNKNFLVLFENENNFTSEFNFKYDGSFSLEQNLKEFIKKNSYINKIQYKHVNYYFPIYLDKKAFKLFYKIKENFILATTANKQINPEGKLYRNLPNEEKFNKLMHFNNIYLFDLDTYDIESDKINMLKVSFTKTFGDIINFNEEKVTKNFNDINKNIVSEIKFIKSNIYENNKFYPKLKLNDYIFSSLRAPEKDKYPYKTTYKEIKIGI